MPLDILVVEVLTTFGECSSLHSARQKRRALLSLFLCSFVQLSAGLWEKTSDRHVTVGKLWALLQSTNRVLVPRRTVTTTTRNDDSAVIKETFNYSFNKDIRFYITFQLSNFTVSFSQFWHIDPPTTNACQLYVMNLRSGPKGVADSFFF